MAIKWIRIDDRLIHGQVATSWLRHVNAQQIICVDDEAANNPVQVQVLKMAAPDLVVHVFGVDKFIEIYKKNPIRRSTFLMLGSTVDVLKLKEGGVEIEYVNYGGMRRRVGRHEYAHDLCFSDAEEIALYKLNELGVKVEYQVAAFDSPTNLITVLKKVKKG
jgi:Phosphotransferase system, mannose/fructose/N-acetylgalactosamine-specific component IIB